MSWLDEQKAEWAAVATELRERYPSLYADTTCEITIGRGWLPLVRELSEKILVTELRYGQQVIVQQVKEKWGTLCVNWGTLCVNHRLASAELEAAIAQAEVASGRCCEDCGEPGHMREVKRERGDVPYLRTLCDACITKFMEPR